MDGKKITRRKKENDTAVYEPHPDDIKALARQLYPAIRAYYESEEGQREWRDWKEKQG